jgi:hypothetical protein
MRLLQNSFVLAGILLALFSPRLVSAQQIMVKLVDGRNGRTLIRNQSVGIWLAEKALGMPNQTTSRATGESTKPCGLTLRESRLFQSLLNRFLL